MKRVLIVEDENHLGEGLRYNLEAEAYDVELVETGEEAISRLKDAPADFDVIVLDVMLPGKDGFQVISELRQAGIFTPALMLTARGQAHDILKGFEAGADDYLTKPFELAILIARIRGLLRRRAWIEGSVSEPVTEGALADTFVFGDQRNKSVNFDSLELSVRGEISRLTLMEANLLRCLIGNEGKPVSRKAILQDVWSVHENTDTRPIDNFVVRLRRYIEDDPTRPRHLLTVRSVGYRFVAFPDSTS